MADEVIYFSYDIWNGKGSKSQFFLTFLRKNNVVSAKKIMFLLNDRAAIPYLCVSNNHVKVTVKGPEVALYGAVVPAKDFDLLLLVHCLLEQVERRLH